MKILLVVDAQNDFMPGGALPVPGGNEIVPIINSIRDKFDRVIFTKDWHPAEHCSFVSQKGPWPVHCVQGTRGAEFHKDLIVKPNDIIIVKGNDPAIDSYSGFYDNEKKKATELLSFLKKDKLWVCGLALEYCVKFTVLDALSEKYETRVIIDACRGINYDNIQKAQEEMMDAGALLTSSKGI